MREALLTDADRFPFDADDRAELADAGVQLRELAGHEPYSIAAAAQGADAIFVYSARFDRELIGRLDGVRVLARCGAGYDNIDVSAARAAGMEVVYVPDYGAEDVSAHALALLLACARRLGEADRAVRAGRWPSYGELGTMHRPAGRTLGLLGYGRIARRLAEKAAALGLRVIAHDPYAAGAEATRDELFRDSDYLSIHVPLTDETRGSVGERELASMKPGAILVNTARGAIVDGVALAAALRSGHLAGAGLDVFEAQPLPDDHPLRACETAIFTPHSAAYTDESLAEVRKQPLADVLRVLRGEAPLYPVPA
jgi:D-3-phosphoglycerate dehydrogenase / 2-oxoglutarate reductase